MSGIGARGERRAAPRAAPPAVLVAAGLDPSGGAGLAADVEALLAVGARALPVATALTVQGAARALRFEPVRPAFVVEQIEGALRGARPAALKTGMIGAAATAAALAEAFARPALRRLPLVVDPVLAASSGLPLLRGVRGRPAHALRSLFARATVVTPNWPELEALAGAALPSEDDAIAAARTLPSSAVLVKGGHRRGPPIDLLVTPAGVRRFEGRRRPGTARGTGCRLASALAGLLARGVPLVEAVVGARRVVEAYLDATVAARR
jgi:hydroxymethylpyrimidine/phosphomethylpyrimidine kinase